jgi:hypothetical protein
MRLAQQPTDRACFMPAANTAIEAIGRRLTQAPCAKISAVFGQKCLTPRGSNQDRDKRYRFGEVRVGALALLTLYCASGMASDKK